MKLDVLNTKKDLTIDEQEFLELHNKGYQAATYSTLYGYEFGGVLKKINDTKKYQAVGYASLEEYTLEVYGMKKSQAYKYINIFETYSPDFFHSSGNLGITKLNLLTSLGSEDEVKEFINENNVSEMTVKQLQLEIEKLKKEASSKETIITQLQLDIEALQSDPGAPEIREVIKEVPIVDEVKIKELEEKLSKAEVKNNELASKLEKIKDSSTKEKIDELNKDIKIINQEKTKLKVDNEALKKKLELSSNEDYNRFKAQFNILQKVVKDTLYMVFEFTDKEFQNKCYIALKTLFEGSLKHD